MSFQECFATQNIQSTEPINVGHEWGEWVIIKEAHSIWRYKYYNY